MTNLSNVAFRLDQPLYDTVRLAASANQTVHFFTVAKGGAIFGTTLKTLAHTNLVQGNILEKGVSFTIHALSLFVNEVAEGANAVTYADHQVLSAGYIRLLLGGSEVFVGKTPLIPAGGAELNYFSNIGTPGAAEYHSNRGISANSNKYHLTIPLDIREQVTVQVELVVPGTIGAVTDVTMVLSGEMERPIR